MPRPRLPIQRMEVPVKVIEAVAPLVADCMAEPALHPQPESPLVHGPLKVTPPPDSSTRLSFVGNGPVVGPPKGWRVIVFTCVTPFTVEVKVAVSPVKRTVAEPTGVTRTCAGSKVAALYAGPVVV
jgi:hypothetical protein